MDGPQLSRPTGASLKEWFRAPEPDYNCKLHQKESCNPNLKGSAWWLKALPPIFLSETQGTTGLQSESEVLCWDDVELRGQTLQAFIFKKKKLNLILDLTGS